MKSKYIKSLSAALALCAFATTGCIEETFPDTNYVTQDQINTSDPEVMRSFANAIVSKMAESSSHISSDYFDIGYPSMGFIRDIYAADFPIYDTGYDYFYYIEACKYLGEYAYSDFHWVYYYKLVMQCNIILGLDFNEATADIFGMAHFYRAFFYFDMARMYEYKPSGFESKDALAESRNLHGLTVPIVTESTTGEEAVNQPRAPYAEMYAFILDDLNSALKILGSNYRPDSKYMPSSAAIYTLMAKVYLEVATHMKQYPADLAALSEYSQFEANSVQGLFDKSLKCAEMAINNSNCRPLTEDEWYGGANYHTGFNTMSSPSWMMGITINKELLASDWQGWIAYMNVENYYGVSGIIEENGEYKNKYKAQRCISSELYSKISDSDWRKRTWISPSDAGDASAVSKYPTSVPAAFFKAIPAYAGLKFRTTNGDMNDYSVGAAVDYPLMRIEEVYFVRMEALAGAQGYAAGAQALSEFVNSYRYTDGSFKSKATNEQEFIDEMMCQKRIEFWGEGIVAFDYKRLNLQVHRSYTGSNFLDHTAFNSKEGYCAPWLNWFILVREGGKNIGLVLNPDPSVDASEEIRE